jgi:hypothetical protein
MAGQEQFEQQYENHGPPLESSFRDEQLSVISFLWSEGVKPREIHRRMIQQCGGSCTSEKKMYQ